MVSSSPPSHTHLLAGDRFTLYFCFWLSCEICVLSCYFAVLTVKHSFEESRISSVILFFCFTFFRLSATREFWRTNRAWVSSSKQPFQFMEKELECTHGKERFRKTRWAAVALPTSQLSFCLFLRHVSFIFHVPSLFFAQNLAELWLEFIISYSLPASK